MRLKDVLIPLIESFKDAKKKFSVEWPKVIVDSALEEFKSVRKRLEPPENDLSYWVKNDFYDFYLAIQREKNRKTKGQQRREIKSSQDYETIYESDVTSITVPFTVEAACRVGQDGNWCVSTRNMQRNMFRNYTLEDGKVYFIFDVDWSEVGKYDWEDLPENPALGTLDIFTLEVLTRSGSIVLWDKDNTSFSYANNKKSLNDFLYLLTQDELYDYDYFVQKGQQLYPEIVEQLEDKHPGYLNELLTDPNVNMIKEQLLGVGERDDDPEEVFGGDYDELAEVILFSALNSSEHQGHLLEVIGMYASAFGARQEMVEAVIKGVLEGHYNPYDISSIEEGIHAADIQSEAGHEFFREVVDGAMYDVSKRYVETGEGFDLYIDFIEAIDHIRYDVEDDDCPYTLEKVFKERMTNAPEDESIFDDFEAVVNSRMIDVDEDLYKELIAIRDRRLKYGDTTDHPELDVSYTTLYVSPSGDKVVQPLDNEQFAKHHKVNKYDITGSIIVMTELGVSVVLKPHNATYWSKINGELHGSQLQSMAAQSDAIRWALEHIKSKLLDTSDLKHWALKGRLKLILQHIKQGIFTKAETMDAIADIAKKITKSGSATDGELNEIITNYMEYIPKDVLVSLLGTTRYLLSTGYDYGRSTRIEKYDELLHTIETRGLLDEQTINALRVTEEESNNEI